jgi:Tfp pilus assembly protein PilZ
MTMGFLEKRHSERIVLSIATKYNLLNEVAFQGYKRNPDFVKPVPVSPSGQPMGQMKDLSEGGMALVGGDLFRAGYKVLVTFEIPDSPPEISCVTEVRWVQQFKEGARTMYRAGLQFLLMRQEDAERLKAYLANHMNPQ